jgi:thiol-disulfide isomerase/thioredoxin
VSGVRRLLLPLGLVALAVVLVIGLTQAGGGDAEPAGGGVPTLAEAKERLAGAPAPLAALHARANELLDADVERQVRALRGYPVVVNKWASWCGPCRTEFPVFARVAAQKGRQVAFLGLNTDDNREEALGFLRDEAVAFPHLFDPDAEGARAVEATGGFPATVFFDPRGEVVAVHQGAYVRDADLLADLRRYAGA